MKYFTYLCIHKESTMESKQCTVCGEVKPLSEFAKNKTKKDGHASDCKACRKKYRDQHYKDNKQYYISKASEYRKYKREELIEYKKGLKCEICGEDRFWCLEFHHKDPNEKEKEISLLVESPLKLKEELKKCIVLCANCHRDLHYKNNAGLV